MRTRKEAEIPLTVVSWIFQILSPAPTRNLSNLKGGVRKDLKYPRTAVSGNYQKYLPLPRREDLNDPFTSVKGISFTVSAVKGLLRSFLPTRLSIHCRQGDFTRTNTPPETTYPQPQFHPGRCPVPLFQLLQIFPDLSLARRLAGLL
jgi:hypothetical protein